MTEAVVFESHARRILAAATEQGVTVRLLGGLAIWIRSPDHVRKLLTRDYADIDLVGHRTEAATLRAVLEELEYVPDKEFNTFQGHQRLYYTSPDGEFHIDVFLDVFAMSHTIDLTDRLILDDVTLAASDLLLTKLQIAEINDKDVRDTVMLLLGHRRDSTDVPGVINLRRVCALCSTSWGLYTTVIDNLTRTREVAPELVESDQERALVMEAVDDIVSALETEPKTRGWRLRARVGRRVRWYTLPDEVE